jgi:hypothetical protein
MAVAGTEIRRRGRRMDAINLLMLKNDTSDYNRESSPTL